MKWSLNLFNENILFAVDETQINSLGSMVSKAACPLEPIISSPKIITVQYENE